MENIAVAAISLIGIGLTQWVVYALARRSKSGKIISSEATDLWRESSGMRDALQAELAAVRTELHTTREENAKCQERLVKMTEWARGD